MKITLRNLKGISRLQFEVPGTGVWVVAGLNGSGKTSLFATLYRLRNKNAFQRYLRSGGLHTKVDRYLNAEVDYEINGDSVAYKYGGQRWRATPKRRSTLLNSAPYSDVIYVEANADRIEPIADEIRNIRAQPCAPEICAFVGGVLGNSKWNDLRFVNTRRGGGARAYLIPYLEDGRTYYYSEKSFSLGELCVLKLGIRLSQIQDNSLVLIDEIELALHPQAQVRLLRELEEVARRKNLTVLFSTHLATIIKSAKRRQLIYLQPSVDGEVTVITEPYPALVLGEIAFDDELSADFIFYVEDREARLLLESMIGIYMANCHVNAANMPLYRIAPVGGIYQVVDMLGNSNRLLPANVRRHAFLDADAQNHLTTALRDGTEPLASMYRLVLGNTHFLPCAPEQGLVRHIEVDIIGNAEAVRDYSRLFSGHNINLGGIVGSAQYSALTNANPRKQAKLRMAHLVETIARQVGIEEGQVRRMFYGKYAEHTFTAPFADLKALLGPIFNAR